MEESLFNTFLAVGILGWLRPLFDRPSQDQITDVSSEMRSKTCSLCYLVVALCLAFLSVGGLIGMLFDREIFRWAFLAGTLGMIVGTWFLPVATKKPKRDIFFGELFRVLDGAILILAFTM